MLVCGRSQVILPFTVSDTSIGIPADEQEAIFQPFSIKPLPASVWAKAPA